LPWCHCENRVFAIGLCECHFPFLIHHRSFISEVTLDPRLVGFRLDDRCGCILLELSSGLASANAVCRSSFTAAHSSKKSHIDPGLSVLHRVTAAVAIVEIVFRLHLRECSLPFSIHLRSFIRDITFRSPSAGSHLDDCCGCKLWNDLSLSSRQMHFAVFDLPSLIPASRVSSSLCSPESAKQTRQLALV
jgi:hypothetical protein